MKRSRDLNFYALILISAFLLNLCGCEGTGSDSGTSVDASPSVPSAPPVLRSVTLQTGHGFECFKLHRTVWCRGVSLDHDLGFVDAAHFTPLVSDSDSNVISLET